VKAERYKIHTYIDFNMHYLSGRFRFSHIQAR